MRFTSMWLTGHFVKLVYYLLHLLHPVFEGWSVARRLVGTQVFLLLCLFASSQVLQGMAFDSSVRRDVVGVKMLKLRGSRLAWEWKIVGMKSKNVECGQFW